MGQGGWSLLEMMAVVSLIGILTTFAFLRLDWARHQVNGDVRSVAVALIAAQRDAMVKHYDVVIQFDTTNRSIHLFFDANNNFIRDAGERTKSVVLNDRVAFGLAGAPAMAFGVDPVNFDRSIGGFPALVFYRNGSASFGGGIYLTTRRALSQPGQYVEDARALSIERATGRIQWWQYAVNTGWNQAF